MASLLYGEVVVPAVDLISNHHLEVPSETDRQQFEPEVVVLQFLPPEYVQKITVHKSIEHPDNLPK